MTADEIFVVFDRRQQAWRRLDAVVLAADRAESCISIGRVTRFQTVHDFTGVLIQIGRLRAKPP